MCAGYFLGRIGGATTFASAKVKNAIGRIGIFLFQILLDPYNYILQIPGKQVRTKLATVSMNNLNALLLLGIRL